MGAVSKVLLRSALAVGALSIAAAASAADITGAGATFPYPVYAKWAEAYKKDTGIGLNYQSIGSGGGIKQINAKTVSFGASDAPLKPEVLEKDGLMQFPTVMGGVVPVLNVAGIKPGELKLSGEVLADIYLGKIKKWNDPAIAKLNEGVKLPDANISVVHRSDGSGTTFIFTNYLGKVSKDWESKVGNAPAVSWPTGVGGKGNEGVAGYVKQLANSIGYVEYAYALQNKLTYVELGNAAGKYVKPDIKTFQAAAAGADWTKAPGFYLILTNQPGDEAWPITGATFILLHTKVEKPEPTQAVVKFFDWAYKNGDKMAEELDYVPMPGSVKDLVRKAWSTQLKDASGKPVIASMK